MGRFNRKEKNNAQKLTFGEIENVSKKYNILRTGEIHTKIIDVPSPVDGRIRIDDELEPSRYIFMEFKGIHDSYYIGINSISFYDKEGNEIPFKNTAVDGQTVDHENVNPAMPPNGWWAVCGDYHSLLFDFGKVVEIESVYVRCTNSASTPKYIHITDADHTADDKGKGFGEEFYIQLAGEPKSPTAIAFRQYAKLRDPNLRCEEVIERLNASPPSNGFELYFSEDGKDLFAFYARGLRTRCCNYFFGRRPSEAVSLVNSVKITDGTLVENVSHRAMTLEELQAVRAIIVSNCVKDKWKSSRDGMTPLRPSDVNLYDLNSILIKPLTKKRNCAFKELFGSSETAPTFYVSHWWGESVLDFIRCCEYHAMMHNLKPSEAAYWVCAYANRQHDLGNDLGTDPAKSSFNQAMALARGVFLVVDHTVTATNRIWVAYELYRTVSSGCTLDIGIYNKGGVKLIAEDDLPDETPYQRNKRELKFPFQEVCEHFLDIQLYKGEASMIIDKVRILNTMLGQKKNLDDHSILHRIMKADPGNKAYLNDMERLSRFDWSLQSAMAHNCISISLSTEGQSPHNFYGFDLIEIIKRDASRKTLIFDDLASMERVTDEVFMILTGLLSDTIDKFVLNVRGCPNLTDACLNELQLPSTLKRLALGIGHARNITNGALLNLANTIPQNLSDLSLDVTGFKDPSGTYLPPRYEDHLQALASNMPPHLLSFELTTTLADDEDSPQGIIDLAKSFQSGMKRFTFFLRWSNFKGEYLPALVHNLPASIEHLSLMVHGGDYVSDAELVEIKEACKKLDNLQTFELNTRDDGKRGYYGVRGFNSFEDLQSLC